MTQVSRGKMKYHKSITKFGALVMMYGTVVANLVNLTTIF